MDNDEGDVDDEIKDEQVDAEYENDEDDEDAEYEDDEDDDYDMARPTSLYWSVDI